jgi:hypothetical protein
MISLCREIYIYISLYPRTFQDNKASKQPSYQDSNHIILRFDPLPISLNSINLISPNLRSQSSFLNRICDSLCSALLDVDKEPDDNTCEDAVDEPAHQSLPISTTERAYKKMNACHVFPVLAMMAAQMFGPTRELTRLKIPYNPTLGQLLIVNRRDRLTEHSLVSRWAEITHQSLGVGVVWCLAETKENVVEPEFPGVVEPDLGSPETELLISCRRDQI